MDESKDTRLFFNLVGILKMARRTPMSGFDPMHHHEGGPHGYGKQRVLKVLHDKDNITQSEIAEILDVRPSSVSEMLGKLEKNDLIVRKQDENDKRITRVQLTDKGREFFEEQRAHFNSQNSPFGELFDVLDEDEKDQLLSLTDKVIGGLKDKGEDQFNGMGDPRNFMNRHHRHGDDRRGFGFKW